MASPRPSFHPWAKLRTLPWGSPPAGLGALSPSTKALTGGSADLLNFYATTYAVAYGQQRSHPLLGGPTGSGFVSNNECSRLLRPCSAAEGYATATSTTTEHFRPLWLPDGRSLLPRHVHPPGSGYLQRGSPSCLRATAGSPRHMRLLQDPPKTAGDSGVPPVPPDVLQKATISIKELSGFTKATPRSSNILPA
ncbi:PPR32 phosphatase, partial [Trogon melanurus]|nr:PPR32 phosphatase [Trogon melanurus]